MKKPSHYFKTKNVKMLWVWEIISIFARKKINQSKF